MRIATAFFALIPVQALAQSPFPVAIRQECIPVAQREGQPTVIQNKSQALRAKAKLASLSPRDRLANQCRAAIRQRQAEIDRAMR